VATVLVISLSDLGRDPRVDRQIDFLRGEHRVIAAGLGPPADGDLEYVDLGASGPGGSPRSGLARALAALRLHALADRLDPDHERWRQRLEGVEADAIVANDAITLPLAFSLAAGRPVVFDAHEYAPVEWETSRAWRLLRRPQVRWACRTYLPQVGGMTAVSPEIAARYEREAAVPATVVTNAPRYEELEPSEIGETIRLVHFGWPDPMRRLDRTIEAMSRLDEAYSLDLLLMTPEALRGELRRLQRLAADDPRIRFLDPVPMRELTRFANRYDIGVHMLPPATFNQRFALPNKFFEYIQARIVPAIGPSPEMARILREWDCGIVAEDYTPDALAAAIAGTARDRLEELKRNADRAARELCAERNREVVLDVVRRALGSAAAPAPAGRTDEA
jgi:glycosyltransferase involved in cell wall biosynthesis